MIYELRTYYAAPGRMADLVDWLGATITGISTRLGFRLVAAWTNTDPGHENEVIYILAWNSREEREERFKALNEDAEFVATFAAIRVNGKPTESVTKAFLQPTDFSPLQ